MKLVVVAWGLALVAGFAAIEMRNGRAGAPAVNEPRHGKPGLFVFLHPHCPCSEATVAELARLAPHIREKTPIFAYFVLPSGKEIAWAKTALYDEAAHIPGVTVAVDTDGRISREFGSRTSGQVLLYGKDGSLAFSGGITPSRGHQGSSPGRTAILDYFSRSTVAGTEKKSPVFGCALEHATEGK